MILAMIFVLLVFLYSLLSKLLSRTIITAPIVFTTAGLLVPLFSPVSLEIDKGALSALPGIGLYEKSVAKLAPDAPEVV